MIRVDLCGEPGFSKKPGSFVAGHDSDANRAMLHLPQLASHLRREQRGDGQSIDRHLEHS